MTVQPDAVEHAVDDATIRRVTIAGVIGQIVEWYDYTVYAATATVLALVFYPPGEDDAALLLTYGLFAVTFVVRPLGGVLCGFLGDRFGRKTLLAAVVLLISAATTAMGLLPSYAAAGMLAPILLLVLRLLQGFSAGGEVAGATSFVGEYAPDRRRGLLSSWLQVGTFLALLLGVVLVAALTAALGQQAMVAWGWRIPFLVAAPLGLIGFYIRSRLEDTPKFTALAAHREVLPNPLRNAFGSSEHRRAILLGATIPVLTAVGFYALFTYMSAYLTRELGLSPTNGLVATGISQLIAIVTIPVAARISDHVGRKPVLAAASTGLIVASVPCFLLGVGDVARDRRR